MTRLRHVALTLACALGLSGCATTPDSSPALHQQAEANLVVNFESWNQIAFVKPDIAGTTGVKTFRPKAFSRAGFVKLLTTLDVPKDFVVVVLDRNYNSGSKTSADAMDEIERFFKDLGFRRVAFHDDARWNPAGGMPILRDTAANKS